MREWIPKFAKGEGPQWTDDWESVEAKEEPSISDKNKMSAEEAIFTQRIRAGWKRVMRTLKLSKTKGTMPSEPVKPDQDRVMTARRRELRRTGYRLDMDVVLASFGHLPQLSTATDSEERKHWLAIGRELLAAFHRTLPIFSDADDSEWRYDIWPADEKVFQIAAARLFECSAEEGREFWQSTLGLPPAAHHHIEEFLNAVLLEAFRIDPPNVDRLLQIWISFADFLAAQDAWTETRNKDAEKVWKVILFLDSYSTSTGNAAFSPLVAKLATHYRNYIERIRYDSYGQSSLAEFLTTDAAAPIFTDALEWLNSSWGTARSYFWKTGIERGALKSYLSLGGIIGSKISASVPTHSLPSRLSHSTLRLITVQSRSTSRTASEVPIHNNPFIKRCQPAPNTKPSKPASLNTPRP